MALDENRVRPVGRGWIGPRRRSVGLWAFVLHRLSGIGLVAYLYLHLAVLNQLRAGPGQWDAFMALARSPLFLALDVILLGGLLIHGLNGLRLMLVGTGHGHRRQKSLFWAGLAIALALTVLGAMGMYRP
jgi:succinate dehydrogenase / fumarate reductase cytochrome b subunit